MKAERQVSLLHSGERREHVGLRSCGKPQTHAQREEGARKAPASQCRAGAREGDRHMPWTKIAFVRSTWRCWEAERRRRDGGGGTDELCAVVLGRRGKYHASMDRHTDGRSVTCAGAAAAADTAAREVSDPVLL